MAKQHVIIGGGPAGMHAIESIRKYEPVGRSEIHLISNEPAYSRMVIPYWVARQIDEAHVLTATNGYYQKMGVTPHVGFAVAKVDPPAKKLTMRDGSTMPYDTLLVATGSSPARPPIPGLELPGVSNLWTMDDGRSIMSRARQGGKVLFIGAGFIGFIILNALYKIGCKLAVVEVEKQVLPRMLDAEAAELVEGWLEKKGVEVYTGNRVKEVAEKKGKLSVKLAKGRAVEADAVVIATGVKPNVGFLKGSGIKVDHGVVVDEYLRTSAADVYAAGDCAQGPDLLGGPRDVHAIQPTAIDHGRIAGANMAGQHVKYAGSLAMNILDICGVQAASFGACLEKKAEEQKLCNPTRPIYRKLVFDDDRIVGGIVLGPTGDVSNLNDMGMVKGFIQTKTRLGTWKKYLDQFPLDIRRAYIACGVAEKLLNQTLLPEPAEDVGYRYKDAQPVSDPGPYHRLFVENSPKAGAGAGT